MADTDYEIILYRKGTAGTITQAPGDATYVIAGSRKLTRNENDISTLEFSLSNGSTVAAKNFLSASFAGWSGGVTGALQLGDYVKYSLYPTKAPTTKTQYFYGKIVELQQTQDGQLHVKALDYLKKLEREYTKVIYKGYVDSAPKTATWADGAVVISGLTDADIVTPITYAALALNDSTTTFTTSTTAGAGNMVTGPVAQPYVVTQNGLLGVSFTLQASPTTATVVQIKVAIQADNGSGAPDGTDIVSATVSRTVDATEVYDLDLTAASIPTRLIVGNLYWIVLTHLASVNTWLYCLTRTPLSTNPYSYYLFKSDGVNWATMTNSACQITVHTTQDESMDTGRYYLSGTNLVLFDKMAAPIPTQSFVTPVRGLVSYFYDTLTNQEIADALLALNTGLISGSSANQVMTSGTFSTLGKRLLESLQELADQYMPSGAWSGYQLAFAHYESGGSHYVKFGQRLTTADASYATFSHGFDSATDDELRIIDWSGLKLRTDLRPSSVVVIGKDATGNPLCYTVTDRALSGSFESRMEGFANVLKLSDENLAKLLDVQARGDGALAAYSTNVWEGQLKVSGVYPDLIDMDTASASFGSGKVITLNLSPLGISALKLKVKGVVVEANTTTITLSNDDVLVDNAQRYYNAKSSRSEAFLAPVGLVDNMYIAVFYDARVDWAEGDAFMGLADGSGNRLTGLVGVECTKHSVSALNLNVYHAEFEMDNGYSTPPKGLSQIWLGSLDTFEGLSAAYLKRYYLYNGSAPIRDERFDKFKTSRLIVDFLTKRA